MSSTSASEVPDRVPWIRTFHPGAIISAAWSDNRVFLAITALTVLAGFVAQLLFRLPGLMRDLFYLQSFQYLVLFLLLPIPFGLLIGRLQVRDESGRFMPGPRGWRIAIRNFVQRFLNPSSLGRALVAGAAVTLILNTYASWKRVIPAVEPFSWDERFAVLDRTLHFGTDPWVLVHPFLTRIGGTLWLDTLYYTWLPLIFSAIGFLIWTRHRDLRLRGLVGIVFVWIGLGAIAATIFSSAGPAFYRHLVSGPDPFAPLLGYLHQSAGSLELFAPRLQETMWALNGKPDADLYIAGISAMPSVHIAMPALFACLTWGRSRLLGLFWWIYTALILLATVHLGWHYAVDGYVSIAAVALYWKLSARLPRAASSPATA